MNKVIIKSIIRHVLTVVATLLAAKGISIDAGTVTSITDLIVGLVLGGGVMVQSYMEKSKPVDVLIDNPIIRVQEPVIEVKQWFLSSRSKSNMKGLHKDLVELINLALVESPYDFVVISGERTSKEQRALVDAKKSRTMNSKHIKQSDGYVHAFDFMALDANGVGTWEYNYYRDIVSAMKRIVARENLDITFGHDWVGFLDSGHVQIGT